MSNADIAVSEITSLDDIGMMQWAKEIADKLAEHYPEHLWAVAWQGGAIVVKNMSVSGLYGMVLENPQKHGLRFILKDAVMKGGELLERCGMRRGKWDGSPADKLEGSDPRFFKPWKSLTH